MRHLEHSDEAIILGSGASTDEAIRPLRLMLSIRATDSLACVRQWRRPMRLPAPIITSSC